MSDLRGSPILGLCFVSCPLPLFAFLLFSLCCFLSFVSLASCIPCLMSAASVACLQSPAASQKQEAAVGATCTLPHPTTLDVQNLGACTTSGHAETHGMQNLGACRTSTRAEPPKSLPQCLRFSSKILKSVYHCGSHTGSRHRSDWHAVPCRRTI